MRHDPSLRPLDLATRIAAGFLLIALAAGRGAAAEEKCSEGTPALFERVSPAVVKITAQSINPYRLQDRVRRVIGSGFIFDPHGLVLTNSHVAFGMQTLHVTLDNGTTVPARLIGADPIFDIALLQIPEPVDGNLPTLVLGDSDRVRVGEDVIAVGNPMGLEQTVTRGIVSGINRILPDTPLSLTEPLIQTDAPINPGNSGGPLLNGCGQVIGINTAIMPDAQNIGFAIPINLVKAVAVELAQNGRVIRPWVGFHGSIIGSELRGLLRLPLVDGLLVEVVEPGSPAEAAGIRGGSIELTIGSTSLLLGGDIVTTVNGAAVTDTEKLEPVMRALKVGSTIKLALYRDGETRVVEYVLPERPLLPGDLPPEQASEPLPSRPPRDKLQ